MTISDLRVIQPQVFADSRGHFFESYNQQKFESEAGTEVRFVQDNQSFSVRSVLRGLHYQLPPHPQGKLVRCVHGAVWDVAVDIRRSSATFGQWFGIELTEGNRTQLWIPSGFAHGFVALSDGAVLLYKTTDYYAPDCDRSIRWDDPDIGIEWPIEGAPLLSSKDELAPSLAEAEVFD
ncbi:MAG TPA: dTDP-4-dehydrorhamnose 3,5-epimerase [Acidimicrobiia bacterium]|nr:dTDP-4-dehydrorhamnose 3,5-epimerase [Acidimicrobiia bacterium]